MKNLEISNETYNTININGKNEPLVLNFWSKDEIKNSEIVKEDWNISKDLIPFWGNWHDVICLNIKTKKIIYFNDIRETVTEWDNIEEFKKSLSYQEETINNSDSIIEEESWIDF